MNLEIRKLQRQKSMASDIKAICQSSNEEMAREAFETFKANWGEKYMPAVESWENNWNNLTAFLAYP